MKAKVPNPTHVEHDLALVGFKLAGHPTVMGPFVVMECFLDQGLRKSLSSNVVERAASALTRWRTRGVTWHQAGNHLVVFIRQKRRAGRPVGPQPTTETQAGNEFELREAGLSYEDIRGKLYSKSHVEIEAIKQRVARYAKRHGLGLK